MTRYVLDTYPEGYKVAIDKISYRYSLIINTPATDKVKSLLVLMMNPSVADEKRSDATINKLLKKLGNQYKKFIIVNTTPVVESNSSKLSNFTEEIEASKQKNIEVIKHIVRDEDNLEMLVATGNVSTNLKKIYVEIMDGIKRTNSDLKYFAFGVTGENYAFHPNRKSDEDLKKLRVIEPIDEKEWLWEEV